MRDPQVTTCRLPGHPLPVLYPILVMCYDDLSAVWGTEK
jgi:hypothetical protein